MSMENVVEIKTTPDNRVMVENISTGDPVTDPSANTQTNTKRKQTLFRHPADKLIGGVCGGLGDYLGVDPTLVRILWVVATLVTGGGGFLAYLALWLLLPVGTAQQGQQRPAAIELNERSMSRAAVVLMTLGGLWLLSNLGVLPFLWDTFGSVVRIFFWPALLIGAGYLMWRGAGGQSWQLNWSGARERWNTRMNGKMPTKADVKESLKDVKQRLPLKRSRRDRLFMGVCGGVGQRLGIDSNLVRLIWAAFSIGSIGVGVLVYIAIGLILPEETIVDVPAYNDRLQNVQVVDGTATHIV